MPGFSAISLREDVPLLRNLLVAAVLVAALSLILLFDPAAQTPILHAILDTGIFLTSAMLALTLWDVSAHNGDALARLLAVVMGFVSASELVHTFTAVDWSTSLRSVSPALTHRLTGTWAPSSYLLPLSLCAVLLLRGRKGRGWILASVMAVATVALFWLFDHLPRFTMPGALGITRPNLVWLPLLWVVTGIAFWRREPSPLGRIIAAVSILTVPTFLIMCWSRDPYDAPALIGHLGKLAGRILLLMSVMQLAALDITRRIRAERELRELNQHLEERVAERTASLTSEMAFRAEAEARTRTQLARQNLLHEITAAIGDRLDLRSIFQIVVRSIEAQLPLGLAAVFVYDQNNRTLTVSNVGIRSEGAAHGLALDEKTDIAIDDNGLSHCLAGQLVYEKDTAEVAYPFPQRLARGGLRSLVIAPIAIEGSVFGVLVAARHEAAGFSSSDCEFLQRLGVHVALAAHQIKLYNALRIAYDDLRRSQKVVLQQERLGALGQMASGIAHDINNAISPLSLTTELLMETEGDLPPRLHSYLESVKRVVDDIAATVARMREFYRPKDEQAPMNRVDLNALAQQTIDLTRARWSDMPQERGILVRLQTAFAPGLPQAAGVGSEIREALTNLIFNAVDAMPEGGGITVTTGVRQADTAGPGGARRIFVDVRDEGVGMDGEARRRCLEPFYTTKGERGTGLGLAMVFGTMQRHGGDIEIESVPGEGTTVRLLFEDGSRLSSEPPAAAAAQVVAPLRILLVDDDPYILDSMRLTLERDGHTVTAADNGATAIEVFHAARAGMPFDIVVTDLGMPGIDGRQIARAIKAASDTPVILLTGWGRPMGEETPDATIDIVLAKPPATEDIRRALAQLAPGR